jgi:hypothetical protein
MKTTDKGDSWRPLLDGLAAEGAPQEFVHLLDERFECDSPRMVWPDVIHYV